jgi:hypothetical protein
MELVNKATLNSQPSTAKCQQLSATQVSAIPGHPGAWYNALKTFP